MNRQHFRAFFWLRWRLLRQPDSNAAASPTRSSWRSWPSAPSCLAVVLFVGSSWSACSPCRGRSPTSCMYVWDGLVAGLLFCWAIGLLAELQRSEALSLEKFLHLPVSLSGAFLLNYLSSLFSLTLMVFVPAMVGLAWAWSSAAGRRCSCCCRCWRLSSDGHGPHVPVSGLAGVADGQQTPAPNHRGSRSPPFSSCFSSCRTCGTSIAPGRTHPTRTRTSSCCSRTTPRGTRKSPVRTRTGRRES